MVNRSTHRLASGRQSVPIEGMAMYFVHLTYIKSMTKWACKGSATWLAQAFARHVLVRGISLRWRDKVLSVRGLVQGLTRPETSKVEEGSGLDYIRQKVASAVA